MILMMVLKPGKKTGEGGRIRGRVRGKEGEKEGKKIEGGGGEREGRRQ